MFWEIRSRGLDSAVEKLPIGNKWKTIAELGNYLLDGKEKTFLVLFQNNMEIRPGGGYIGSFGIIKVKDGKITQNQIHDLSNFDKIVPNTEAPPYPLNEVLNVEHWKFRDSNFSPDFPTNAEKAEYFYKLGQGKENFDGVIGITANVLTSFLKATGPIKIEGYPGTYADENAIIALEYQVEKGYTEQGIEKGERKSVMNDLAKEIINKVSGLGIVQKMELMKIILSDLDRKDIQLYLKDENLEKKIENTGWSGEVDPSWSKDYLMVSDANLGAYKSDYYVKRSIDYSVDLSKETPAANLKITYHHTAEQRDWMTKNYLDYLRIYVPENCSLANSKNTSEIKSGTEFGKAFFGSVIAVPLGEEKTIEYEYSLPEKLKDEPYGLKIQKQAGMNSIPVKIHLTNKDGNKKDYEFVMDNDTILSGTK